MMKKSLCVVFGAGVLGMLVASPSVSVVRTVQDSASREVTVAYELSGESAVITVDVQTNNADGAWVSIGDANLTSFAGDVNRVVEPGSRQIKWRPDKAWPGQQIADGTLRVGVTAWALNAPPDYMAVNLIARNAVFYYVSAEAVPGGVTNDLYKGEVLLMRKIPAANVKWRMGSPENEYGRQGARETPHSVTLTNDFYLGVYPVTQRQYEILCGNRPSHFTASYPFGPVECVSWETVRGTSGNAWPNDGHAVGDSSFLGQLAAVSGMDGFDLPLEAQWEFACRAGCGAAFYNDHNPAGNMSSYLAEIARYSGNSGDTKATAPVGQYAPNAWGLYDMLGNVWEWTLDWYCENVMAVDPERGGETGEKRITRGGCSGNDATYCRCAYRDSALPTKSNDNGIGFRVARVLP